jgi:hypothetical protein
MNIPNIPIKYCLKVDYYNHDDGENVQSYIQQNESGQTLCLSSKLFSKT